MLHWLVKYNFFSVAFSNCHALSFWRFQLGTVNFTPDDETHKIRDTNSSSTVKNALHQSHKLADGTGNGLKTSTSPGISLLSHVDKNIINGCGMGANITSEKVEFFEGGFSSASEAVNSSYFAENDSPKGSAIFKKPPYTLGHVSSLPQKSAERASREYPSQGIERHGRLLWTCSVICDGYFLVLVASSSITFLYSYYFSNLHRKPPNKCCRGLQWDFQHGRGQGGRIKETFKSPQTESCELDKWQQEK